MTITLELPPDLEARFIAEASATGVQLGEVVKAYLYRAVPDRNPNLPTVDEIDRAFDEAADLVPEGVPPLSDEAMSRENPRG